MIQHNKPTIGKEEEEAALRVLRSGWLSQGQEVESFEKEFCKFVGLPEGHAVAVSNGTSALFLALWALGAHEKNITFPVYVCAAIRHAIGMASGHELPIDITQNSPNLDPGMISHHKDEIKIIPHMYGIPIDLSNFGDNVIEDCSQALGAKINEISVGLQGTIGIFSFYATKLMTSGGQGGMVVSKDINFVEAIRDYREYDYRHDTNKRFNFQMTDIQAAIGREQLKKLPCFLERREKIFNIYKNNGLDLLDVNDNMRSKIHPVRYRAILKTKDPNKVITSLKSSGIEARIPTEDWELLGEPALFPNALRLTKETVSLPIYPSLSDEDAKKIASAVKT